jgi:beta-lactam-binding protein with PASTA domain
VPDLRGMTLRAAVSSLVARSYRARAAGSGVVVAQIPPAGAALAAGETCSVILSAPVTGAAR